MKQRFWLQIDSSNSINWYIFNVVPSIINANAENVLFHCLGPYTKVAQTIYSYRMDYGEFTNLMKTVFCGFMQ
jgi:hypothetical protein